MTAFRSWIVVAGSAGLMALALPAQAGEAPGCGPDKLTIAQVMAKSEVSTYDQAGEFKGRIPVASIAKGSEVLECQDTPARRVKVQVTGKEPVWVDRLQIKFATPDGKAARSCKAEAPSAPNGVTAPAVSGIDPCS